MLLQRLCRGFVQGLVFAVVVRASAAVSAADEYTPGVPWVGEPAIQRRIADLAQSEAAHASPGKRPWFVHKLATVEFPESAEGDLAPTGPAGPAPLSPIGSFAQTVGTNFLGATLFDCQAYPPDTMGAAGPTQFIVALNGRIRSFNKNTGVADNGINVDTDLFFSSVMTPPLNQNFTSDPRIRYDRLSGRWFIIMIDVPGLGGTLPDRIMIAVSDGPVITSGTVWSFFQFQHDLVSPAGDSGKFADYPTLGIDANALYIGVNIFSARGQGSFSDSTGFVVRKSSLLSGGPIVVTAFRSLIPNGNSGGAYTPQGVDNYDPDATEGYFIGVNSRFFGRLSLRRISNPGGTPSISANINFDIPINGGTINVPHLGNTGGAAGNLDGLDYRLLAAHIRNGHLWTTANLAVDSAGSPSGIDSRMGVRWYELQGIATGQTPSVVQSGTLFDATAGARCFWMGTVMVSGQGHAAMGFSVAGANDRVNAGTVGRLKNDAAGTMRTPILYTGTTTSYNPRDANNNPIERWGDYSFTSLDPNDDMTMWTVQEFCNADNSYAVQIARLLAPPPAVPAACNPSTLTQGVVNASVTLTGTSDGDTGFFDPGAGFSNRIAAAVSGAGVTVSSITFNNPTNLTLQLSVAGGAATGPRSLTITNPDGQFVSSASGILTIAGSVASNHPPSLTAISNRVVNEGQALTFTNTATDPDGNLLTFSLDPGAPTNAVINPTNGVFLWVPTEAQGPSSNFISIRVTDNGAPPASDVKTFSAIVNEVNAAPVLSPIANRAVHAGRTLTFTNSATDADLPVNALTFALDPGAPATANVDPATGVFTWLPGDADANTTNNITVRVSDNGVPPLNDAKTFSVNVVSRPIITSIAFSNGAVTMTWTSLPGQAYRLQFKPDLGGTNWSDIVPDVIASGPSAGRTDASASGARRFYRVRLVP